MKASKVFAISLAGILAACAIPFGTVFAAADARDYPVETETDGKIKQPFEKTLEIEAITDYAVYGDSFSYASDFTITILSPDESGERKPKTYNHEYTVEKLDYDESGNLYFENSSRISYLYSVPVTPQEHTFQSIDGSQPVIVDSGYYALNSSTGELLYYKSGVPESLGTGFSKIKKYGEYVYAIKDGAVPYRIDGQTATPVDLSYTDFSAASDILCSEAATTLASGSGELKTANIARGKYYTKIDADSIGTGETDTFKPQPSEGSTKKAEGDKPCLVLCTSGKTAVVATNEGMYITSTDNLKNESEYSPPRNDWAVDSDGKLLSAYAVEDVGVYAQPFMCAATRVATLESGAENRVEVVERFELDFINTKFYKVRYAVTDKETGAVKPVEGYVAANMLTQYDYRGDDKIPAENGDKEFKYETNVVSVVLAIVIVALVIVAIMYIALVGTKKDRQKREKKVKKKKPSPQIDDYDGDDEE